MGNILAIDYGERHTGLAFSPGEVSLSLPYKEIETEKLESALPEIINEKEVEKIVVGVPLDEKGENTKQAEKILEFVDEISDLVTVPVETWDEKYTSAEAKPLSGSEHIQAARILLEDYLQGKD